MRRAAVVAAAFGVFFGGGGDASAAATARLDLFPERPRAGEPATIQLRPFWTFVGRTPPAVFEADYPMIVVAFGENGRTIRIRLARDADDLYVWRGTLRFPSRGRWTVCGANWQMFLDRPCATTNPTRRRVRVRARDAAVDVWHGLQRPLKIPAVADGAPCPMSAPDPKGDLRRLGFAGTAWGEGPAYPAGLGSASPVLRYDDPIPPASGFYGSAWFGNKVLWVVDRDAYRGPLLIRGRQLDGPNLLRFERGRVPPRELRIVRGIDIPSYTRVRAAGCYAYQVDGIGFSYTIVFEARPS